MVVVEAETGARRGVAAPIMAGRKSSRKFYSQWVCRDLRDSNGGELSSRPSSSRRC
jgi:hypothetical protein